MKPFISMRLGMDQQKDFTSLKKFVEIFNRNKGCCDEVWYSTLYGYPKRETHKEMAEENIKSAKYMRENNILVSLQISNTVGHGSYSSVLDCTGIEWDCMVGPDGTLSEYCACPRDKAFLDYIYDITSYYAKMKPANVWIDDDIRMNNHSPVSYGCFCGRCIDDFNAMHKTNYERSELHAAVNDSLNSEWREKWVEFNQDSLVGVAERICRAIMKDSPESVVGVQMLPNSCVTYNGDFKILLDKIKEFTGKPSVLRPGGGFYNDHNPRDVFGKAIILSHTAHNLPEGVEVVQAEIENIPHAFSGKSAYGTLLESAVDLAYGCTSLSYSAFMTQNEDIDYYEGLLSGLSRWSSFLRDYAALNKGTVNGGAGMVFSSTHNKTRIKDMEPFWWSGYKGDEIYNSVFYGLPLSWQGENTFALLLHYSEVDALSDEEIRDIFSKGVITDATTVQKLNERNLSDILQMEAEDIIINKSCEVCSDHDFNGGWKGQTWHNFYSFLKTPKPKLLYPKNEKLQVISNYVLRQDKTTITGISAVIQETSLGGKAAVFAYSPWEHLINSARREQMLNALDWVSDGKMPVYLETATQAAVIPRVDSKNMLRSVMIVNTSIEHSPKLVLYLRNISGNKIIWVRPDKEEVLIKGADTAKGIKIELESLGAWSLGYLRFE